MEDQYARCSERVLKHMAEGGGVLGGAHPDKRGCAGDVIPALALDGDDSRLCGEGEAGEEPGSERILVESADGADGEVEADDGLLCPCRISHR